MITQSLHNTNKNEQAKGKLWQWILCLVFLAHFSYGQDSIKTTSTLGEKKMLQFEKNFFEALTQKAINNYQRAIDFLEECYAVDPQNQAVLFELSKNYFYLNKIPEALLYANEALLSEKDNLWILQHIVDIHKNNRNFIQAIKVQASIVKKYPKEKKKLVFLYLQNNNKKEAKRVLDELADKKMLDTRLRILRDELFPTVKKQNKPEKNSENNIGLKARFEKEKSYKVLYKLLIKLDKENNNELLYYSEQGMLLFPAQPFVYFMRAKALNKMKKHKSAIEILENGIDFIIDDRALKRSFYKEFVKAYKSLGDTERAKKYQQKPS